MRGPAEAVKRIDSYVAMDMPPKAAARLLIEIIEDQNWTRDETSDELAAIWFPRFSKLLAQQAAKDRKRGIFRCFAFNSADAQYIQGSCFIEPNDSEQATEAKTRRANYSRLTEAFKEIGDDEFEALCSKILTFWGVNEPIKTKASADQGIDFFGKMDFGAIFTASALGPSAEEQMKVWLIGQAKNYSTSQVSTSEIREFVGSVGLARSKVFAGSQDPLPQLKIRKFDPVFLLFFTTGSISRDARQLLGKAGVVAMDGQQLAVLLADKGIGITDGRFDGEAFRGWAVN